jgi:hypothetical protein
MGKRSGQKVFLLYFFIGNRYEMHTLADEAI